MPFAIVCSGMADPVTVRIPELPSQSLISLDDKVVVWVAADNKTRQTSVQDLRTLILTGGTGSHAPVYKGGSIIYDVPEDIPDETQIAAIPSLAGMNFILRRGGFPLKPQTDPATAGAQYEVLDGGGFKLLIAEDYLAAGERFELDVFELQGGAPPTTPGSSAGSLISGVAIVTTNLTLNPTDHLNKLIQIRADATQVTVTLPDIDDLPDNTIIPIETTILNSFQNKIITQGGQYIYMRNQSVNFLYMGISEAMWLYRGEDGYYVINDFSQIYERIGKVESSYRVNLNEVVADGSLLQRATHPRLWAYAQTLGASIVSEATWQTASVTVAGRTVDRPYRGCFSTGDGSTTFRVPDLMNSALRGIKSLSGSDGERHFNGAGGFQRHEFESHAHAVKPADSNSASGYGKTATGSDASEVTGIAQYNTNLAGGAETRMDNVGILWTIKE